MKQILSATLILFQLAGFAQPGTGKDSFDFKVVEAVGDLNRDNLPDKVIITQDTTNKNAPYRLQVFFRAPDGRSQLIVSSTGIIAPQYPDGTFYPGFRQAPDPGDPDKGRAWSLPVYVKKFIDIPFILTVNSMQGDRS
jgi:hypothetical protein